MSYPRRAILLLHLLAIPLASVASQSDSPASPSLVVIPTAGPLDFGNYFTGPSGVSFSNENGMGYGAQLAVRIAGPLQAIGSVLHASSDWSFDEIPLLGRITVEGASLWFYDAGLRAQTLLDSSSPVSLFGQITAGAIRYAVDNPLLTGRATNLTVSGGVGLAVDLGERFSFQGMVKDYFASFRSVEEGSSFGIEGRHAHTLALLFGLGLGL